MCVRAYIEGIANVLNFALGRHILLLYIIIIYFYFVISKACTAEKKNLKSDWEYWG